MKEDVICEDALEEALHKCIRGVLYKASVAYFYLNSVDCIPQLQYDLDNDVYKARKPRHFVVHYPKQRNIVSIAFRDRVFQRSLNDNIVYPKVTKSFIFDNMACQKGKGDDLARTRMKLFLEDYWHKYGTDGYALKLDIKKYYDSIPHSSAKKLFSKYLDGWDLEQVCKVLDNQYPTDIGFNAGSQMVQILGIALPNFIDHYCKEELHLKYYMRYQDDTIAIYNSAEYLEMVKQKEILMLSQVGLKLNLSKTKIIKLTDGFEFLGFQYRLTKSGKVIMSVCSAKVKQEYRHLRHMVAKSKRGELPKYKVDKHLEGVLHHYSKGNSNKLIARTVKFYKSLWRD